VYGGVPLEAIAVNVIGTPDEGLEGEYVKLVVKGCGLDESFQAVKGWSSQWPASQ